MYPLLGQLGPFKIYSFGFMLATAVMVCSYLLSRDARAYDIPREKIFDLVFWVILAGILGARIFFILLNLRDFVAHPGEIVMISNGGLAWQGGLVSGGFAAVIFIKMQGFSLRLLADLSAPYLALGQAIGRLGCFLNGCCYGREVPSGLYFPVHHSHLHPTQLYESGYLIILFFILKNLHKKLIVRGEIFSLYLMFAAAGRFGNEFFRADHVTTLWGMSVFQLVSLVVFCVGLYMWRRLQRPAKSGS